jgi:hypothetical protein
LEIGYGQVEIDSCVRLINSASVRAIRVCVSAERFGQRRGATIESWQEVPADIDVVET